jgi:hypothetical protein
MMRVRWIATAFISAWRYEAIKVPPKSNIFSCEMAVKMRRGTPKAPRVTRQIHELGIGDL